MNNNYYENLHMLANPLQHNQNAFMGADSETNNDCYSHPNLMKIIDKNERLLSKVKRDVNEFGNVNSELENAKKHITNLQIGNLFF